MPAVTRTHRLTVDPQNVDVFLSRRAAAIGVIRAGYPGLTGTRLIRHDDETFTDTWQWASPEQMRAAAAAARTLPQVGAAMSLARDHTAIDGVVVDER
jgi:hypothetical protein